MKLSQIDKFHEDGYFQLDDTLALADIDPVLWEFEGIIDRRARELYTKGGSRISMNASPLTGVSPAWLRSRIQWQVNSIRPKRGGRRCST